MNSMPVAISYSGGASSEWIVEALIRGVLPRPYHVCVVFADTGDEHAWTYEAAARVEQRCADAEIRFIRCQREERLREHLLRTSADRSSSVKHPPLWVAKGSHARGRALHKCTIEFKVAPMRRAVSAWLKELKLPKHVTRWIGFGADEQARATKALSGADVAWERLDFPAIRLSRKRSEQRAELEAWTGRTPPFSMCRVCPYKSVSRWLATAEEELDAVYEVDDAIRDMSHCGLDEGECYLTDRLIPVRRLIERGDPQPELPGLESYCDGGACFL